MTIIKYKNYLKLYKYYWAMGRMVRVLANGSRDRCSIPSRDISKMVRDAFLFKTQHFKVRIKSKWSNLGKGVAPSLTLGVVAIERGAFESHSITVGQLTYIIISICHYITHED